ncbi:MAG: DUF938 domain-containing protein [Ketobacter sp.]|nr:MAG: DUF938 domain-containing protein [Ketobacter sp.]
MNKPFSQACENNKAPILSVLQHHLKAASSLLEVGSGTGQHAAYMATHLPYIQWQPSDVDSNLSGIRQWCDESNCANLLQPVPFDVNILPHPNQHHHLFSANTLHIMSWDEVQSLFKLIPHLIYPEGFAFFYGPFKYDGQFTSPSNADFDLWLKQRGPHQGIRDFEAVRELAERSGLSLIDDVAMPANNQLLVWRRER